MNEYSSLWYSGSENDWMRALDRYWTYVRPENLALEKELNSLCLDQIAVMDKVGWYQFLHDKYFRWKYTAPNRYKTTTSSLRKYVENNELEELHYIKERLLNFDPSDIRLGLLIASEIHGLGIAGASGLLSLMYPEYFATVDQFVVKAFQNIDGLNEQEKIQKVNPENISISNAILLINLMQTKAGQLNTKFNTNHWTPRKIDMVFWATRG